MKIGFIGLGNMGAAMATNLLRAGHDLTVYNRTASKAKALTDRGAHLATKVADACHGDAVITMLADDRAVEAVVFDEGGLLQNLDQRTIHVSMSTISLALSQRLTEAHKRSARRFITAPVFGRPDVAAAGKLYIVVAGSGDLIDVCAPLLNAMGQKTLTVSDKPPEANLVKLSGNFLLASIIEALGEAFALIGKAGIDRHHYFEILTSTLFTGPAFTNYGGLIAGRKFHPALFAAPLGAKDIRLTLAAGESLRVPMPLGNLLHDRFLTLLANGGEGLGLVSHRPTRGQGCRPGGSSQVSSQRSLT